MLKIGNLSIQTPVFLAPMAGVTDYSFRILCKEQGAGIVYSEFVSAHGIIRKNDKTLDMIRFSDTELSNVNIPWIPRSRLAIIISLFSRILG